MTTGAIIIIIDHFFITEISSLLDKQNTIVKVQFNVDVKWLPGSASPSWLSQAASSPTFTINNFIEH